jgi:hypothetical protein
MALDHAEVMLWAVLAVLVIVAVVGTVVVALRGRRRGPGGSGHDRSP